MTGMKKSHTMVKPLFWGDVSASLASLQLSKGSQKVKLHLPGRITMYLHHYLEHASILVDLYLVDLQ